jgi:ubiquinone/menaquinone biosynthesis C-methylase UbiE
MTQNNAMTVRDLIEGGKLDQAFDVLKSKAPDTDAVALYCDLGLGYRMAGNFDRAITCLEKAMGIGVRDARPRALMAEICLVAGYMMQAIEYMGQASTLEPDNREYRQKLLLLLSEPGIAKFNPLLKKTLGESLRMDGLDLSDMGDLWLGLLRQDPAYKELYKAGQKDDYGFFLKAFGRIRPKDREALADGWFLEGLRTLTVYNPDFEKFMTYLRRLVLDCQRGAQDLLAPAIVQALAPAVAQYAFFTEYVFAVDAEEQAAVDALDKGVPDAAGLAVLCAYRALKDTDKVPADADAELVAVQRDAVKARAELKTEIESITPTTDDVSLRVQAQYEDFPYPAWRGFMPLLKDYEVEGGLINSRARILIAGSGTGKEAIELAGALPDAEIVAVDLSRASLSYGQQKARAAGIGNVRFVQGDINALPDTLGLFDYVTSSGVLHHMADPLKGWRVITGLLKPGGLMRIALYSKAARRHINAARAVIGEEGIGDDAAAIRDFRSRADELLEKDTVANLRMFRDYYSMSECRDLLFHVQEHQFDLPQITAALDGLGLAFKKFYLPPAVMRSYAKMNPTDAAGTDLAGWARFEEKNPNTFIGMYRFWCTKP